MVSFVTFCLLLLVAVAGFQRAQSVEVDSRIIGGYTSTIRALPYLVNIRRDSNFICGGTLVSSKLVVTAAHCVHGYDQTRFTVVGGATYLSETGVRRSVKWIILPSKFSASTLNMDVTVLVLTSAMTGTNIGTIPLCSAAVPTGASVRVSGWGLTSENGSASNQVRSIDIPTISKSKCQTSYRNRNTLTASMMCASEAGSKDSCNGDSGGPLVYKNQLCGIVSWGIGCAQRNYPGVYTDVHNVRSFIDKVIHNYG